MYVYILVDLQTSVKNTKNIEKGLKGKGGFVFI